MPDAYLQKNFLKLEPLQYILERGEMKFVVGGIERTQKWPKNEEKIRSQNTRYSQK